MIQKMTNFRRGFVFAVIGMAIVPCVWAADPFPKDVPGSADPAIIKRFTGSTLIGYKIDPWASARFPTSPAIDRIVQDKPFKNLVTIEGSLTRAVYLSPEGKSPLEIYRNYEQALNAAGFKKKFSCEVDCSDVYFALGKLGISDSLIWAKGYIPNGGGGSYNPSDALTHEDGRLLVGTLTQAGAESWLMVYVSKAVSSSTHFSQAFVQVLETKAMQTGQVTVLKAVDIQSGLHKEGKVAFYGLYFDTGKSEIKPTSKLQLDEMGKLLKSQPSLQVFVVGHTDGQGQLEANLQLSQLRAQAVVNALTKEQGIEAKRLIAKGVASLAPLSTNESEEGRARNRRVELVVR
jgi:OOP family OmpA-OmpF porin